MNRVEWPIRLNALAFNGWERPASKAWHVCVYPIAVPIDVFWAEFKLFFNLIPLNACRLIYLVVVVNEGHEELQ